MNTWTSVLRWSSTRPETIQRFRRGANVIVRCPEDYERAVERIAELGIPSAGSVEEAELDALLDATDEWDAHHEDDDCQ